MLEKIDDQTRTSRTPHKQARVSFEFFPPKTEEMETQLWEAIERLAPLAPDFVSVTYSAGGSTRERTHSTVARIVRETAIKPAAHLTCVAATREEIDDVVRAYHEAGVRHVVALRGDPSGGVGTSYEAHPGGYATSTDLVRAIRRNGDFEVSVSAYRKATPRARPSIRTSMRQGEDRCGRDARHPHSSCSRTISTSVTSRSRAEGRHRHSDPAGSGGGAELQADGGLCQEDRRQRAAMAGRPFRRHFENDPATRRLIAAAVAAEQALDLMDHGVENFHFYTMNRADLVFATCHLLGVRAKVSA